MEDSNQAGQEESKPEKTLIEMVLSWSVDDILNHNRPPIEVETIPNEFQTCKHYKEAFRSPMLEEIFYQIDSAMVTISKGIYVEYFEEYRVMFCLPKGEDLLRKSDVMLLSARKLESRDQILKDNSFCTILVVTETYVAYKSENYSIAWMHVLLSKSPHKCSPNRMYQVMHLTNLSTEECSWQVMTSGFKDTSGILNLILRKSNNGPNRENKASSSEAAIFQFGLNQSQGNAVASCISSIEHSSNSVRLVWGPPGTGKTKTISVILYFLLKMVKKPSVLVCAPTNTAVAQLTRQLISLLDKSSEAKLIQDIILLGNEERLGVKMDKDLKKVYVKYPEHAKLVFCTPFHSSRVQQEFNILVIDEAAYLKECETMIPLAHTKIEHLVLIGDDKQLQSLVKSPKAKGANYGRSMFGRLSDIGCHKDLLNVQYRMHPCIRQFPNEKFYDNKIIDGPNVKEHLPGSILGNYSFIQVEGGFEEYTSGSFRNKVEVDVAAKIVCRLAKETTTTCAKQEKQTSVGIISQYKAQITALKKRIGKYQEHPFLSVQIDIVASFQGDEKDIIILSTVRHNSSGDIGFLRCQKRANVALTRAKNSLWILGHEETLQKSNSIWHDLVQDAKRHLCWLSADEVAADEEATESKADAIHGEDIGEEETEAEADAVEGEDIKIDTLGELPQLSQTVERVKVDYKGPSAVRARKALNKRLNFYEKERTSRDPRFWSYEQEDLYFSVYKMTSFTDNRWINWKENKHSKDKNLKDIEEKCLQIGLHTLLSKKQDWDEEIIRQFFSTFYVDPSGTFLMWMTGINRKITATKRFCQKVLLDPSMHHNDQRNNKLKEKLDHTKDEVVNKANGDLKNLILRLLDKTILPRGRDRGAVHGKAKVLMYHFLLGKPFNFVDMFSQIQKTRSDTRMLMPYAPFIMLLINRATSTNEEFVRRSEGFKHHTAYDMYELRAIRSKKEKASKPKDRVPPLTKRQRLQ